MGPLDDGQSWLFLSWLSCGSIICRCQAAHHPTQDAEQLGTLALVERDLGNVLAKARDGDGQSNFTARRSPRRSGRQDVQCVGLDRVGWFAQEQQSVVRGQPLTKAALDLGLRRSRCAP